MDIATAGDGHAIAIALHGIQGTRATWVPLAQQLGDSATFVLPNLRGRGAGYRGASMRDYTLASYAADLAEVVAATAHDRPYVLAGWSMGVSVALEFLARGAARPPAALVLVSGTPALCAAHWFTAHDDAHLLDEIALREQRLRLREAADRQAVAWTWQTIRGSDQRAVLGTIDIPALVVHGGDDGDCPLQHARWLANGLRRARLEVIDGAGHSVLVEHTAAVGDAVRAFLRDLIPFQETP